MAAHRAQRTPQPTTPKPVKRILGGLLAVGALAICGAGTAVAAPVKHCEQTAPFKNGWAQTTTNDQTSSCNSNSDTGYVPTGTSATNPAGKNPGGFNK